MDSCKIPPPFHFPMEAEKEAKEKLIEISADAKIAIDEHGRICIFNKKAELLFGYHRTEVIGQPIHMLLPEERRTAHVGHIAKFMENIETRGLDQSNTMDLQGQDRDGRKFPVAIKVAGDVILGFGKVAMAIIRRRDE